MKIQADNSFRPLAPKTTFKTSGSSSDFAADPTDSMAPIQVNTAAPVRTRASVSPALVAQQSLLGNQVAQAAGVTIPPTTRSAVLRDPQHAVSFVNTFNQQLQLPADTLAVKESMTVSSPAKFLRVNPALFYEDLKGPYAAKAQLLDRPAPIMTIQGDCHLGNFGTIRAAGGQTIWGMNDYDMAGKGSAEYDLERLATSLILMAPSSVDSKQLIAAAAHSYVQEMARLSGSAPPQDSGLESSESSGPVQALIQQQSGVSQHHVIKKFCTPDGTQLQRNEELLQATPQQQQLVQTFLDEYDKSQGATPDVQRPIKLLDVAQRVESGGSTYGLHRFYALVQGTGKQPVILEIKQELPTAPDTISGDLTQANAQHIQQGMQDLGGLPNPLMTCATLDGSAYFIREREREKGSIDLTTLSPSDWTSVVQQAGVALARAHAHQPGVAAAVTQWVGKDEDAMTAKLQDFGASYAEQTRQDTQAFAATLKGVAPEPSGNSDDD